MSSDVACQAVALYEGWRHPAKAPLRLRHGIPSTSLGMMSTES
jgi:hypothetical protein